jgi:hypothetical protein
MTFKPAEVQLITSKKKVTPKKSEMIETKMRIINVQSKHLPYDLKYDGCVQLLGNISVICKSNISQSIGLTIEPDAIKVSSANDKTGMGITRYLEYDKLFNTFKGQYHVRCDKKPIVMFTGSEQFNNPKFFFSDKSPPIFYFKMPISGETKLLVSPYNKDNDDPVDDGGDD